MNNRHSNQVELVGLDRTRLEQLVKDGKIRRPITCNGCPDCQRQTDGRLCPRCEQELADEMTKLERKEDAINSETR